MSRSTSDDQLKFLLSCVRHASHGRVDFVEVAKECGVVSKGAAAKRYERLMKAIGISPSGGPSSSSPPKPTISKPKAKGPVERPSPAKKQKLGRDSPAFTSKKGENVPMPMRMTAASPQGDACGPTPTNSETFHSIVGHNLFSAPGKPQQSFPTLLATSHPGASSWGQSVTYSAPQQSPFAGFPAFACGPGHQLVPDVHMYPPFPPAFREPWSFTCQEDGRPLRGFGEYASRNHAIQQNQADQPPLSYEAMPLRLPPQPQEVVPIQQPGERQPEVGDEYSEPKGHVVVVE
ncbi:uncharacterized protein Z519_06771 [Cladophialophora bantiana CBS 173.52]|uniref:Myb-like DNA-binding domain-containing protein n=1 Tax=Cladophialophora bantiana (strain ATCC 10958 / CBS 173.52 / CDC B-1940 / NIH 8579) TaxID=1442370 RepID=A0A0D2G2I0_CLAB1|nr:uncharacterized protein Z519_06771 [Cladophialophora bantiana CBS 173.52]KIW92922.1 hypothetical protein Z519_06771 [Cladophialophora bantiana CBS 173.52]